MYDIKTLDGTPVRVGFRLMAQLIVSADWQIRNMGYDPASVTAAYLKATEK